MKTNILLLITIGFASTKPQNGNQQIGYNNRKPNPYELEQNQAAKYKFSTNIEDNIQDLTHQRTEVRDGLKVKGSYSYSDGFHKRTVEYEADENGYRVLGTHTEPLDGPQINLSGTASVNSNLHGRTLSYSVKSIPVPGPVAKVITKI